MSRRAATTLFCFNLFSFFAATAFAAVPSAPNSTMPPVIVMVGKTMKSGVPIPDPAGSFQVVIRDFANNPVSGSTVSVDFSACTQTFAASEQVGSGGTPCLGIVTAVTNAVGVATFIVEGSTLHRAPAEPAKCAIISATTTFPNLPATVPLTTGVPVSAFDEDGVNGVRGNDLRLWLCDYFALANAQRSDFNGGGTVDLYDIAALWENDYTSGASDLTSDRCDGSPTTTGADVYPANFRVGAALMGPGQNNSGGCGATGPIIVPCGQTPYVNIVVSATPPVAVAQCYAFEADFDLIGPVGAALPDYWRFEAGGCDEGALGNRSGTFVGAKGYTGCPWAFNNNGTQFSISYVEYPYPVTGEINKARVRVVGTGAAVSVSNQSLNAGTEYTILGLGLAGDDITCGGCATNVALVLKSLRINQPVATAFGACGEPNLPQDAARSAGSTSVGRDMIMLATASNTDNILYFNGVPAGYVVADVPGTPPRTFVAQLAPAAPNPTRGSTRIPFTLARDGEATLTIFDLAGRRIRELARGLMTAGEHAALWDGHADDGAVVPGGIYFVRLRTHAGTLARTLVVMR